MTQRFPLTLRLPASFAPGSAEKSGRESWRGRMRDTWEQSPVLRCGASARNLVLVRGFVMIEMLAVILIVMWLLGMVTSYTMNGFIHLLLVIAVIVFLLRVIQGRRVL